MAQIPHDFSSQILKALHDQLIQSVKLYTTIITKLAYLIIDFCVICEIEILSYAPIRDGACIMDINLDSFE